MRAKTVRLLAGAIVTLLLLAVAFATFGRGVKRGRLETTECGSKITGGKRRMIVYLPPDYPQDAPYPVLYLIHGAGGDESSWHEDGAVDALLDRLYAEKKIAPMIAVMPNAQPFGSSFERDLLEKIVPFVDSHYATQHDSQGRGMAGVSLGGGQALSIGLKHTDRFAWVGGFAPSLGEKTENDVIGDPSAWNDRLKLLWLSCGDKDRLRVTCESLHGTLQEKNIPHIWHMGSGEHDWPVWQNDFRRFAPLLFRGECTD